MTHVQVKPELLRWACERSHIEGLELNVRFPLLSAWERGEKHPTFRQLETFANATHTPIGYLFLPEAPAERLPIRDLRTVNGPVRRPSADLLDTIYAMQRRQDWLREDRMECEADPLYLVGSARLDDDPEAVGREMRRVAGIGDEWASSVANWHESVGELRRAIENLGVTAVINGVVGNNTHRKLDVGEFRGFALVDRYAPLIFVNGSDSKSAQMFTLAHELAHVWLGSDGEGLSGFEGLFPGDTRVERFCDRAAAEFLVPARQLREVWRCGGGSSDAFDELARTFKVSPVVLGRRALDLHLVSREVFFDFYESYSRRERRSTRPSGGDFYANQNTRIGAAFATSVIRAAVEGRLSFEEAYNLTGLYGGSFQEYARRLGVWML